MLDGVYGKGVVQWNMKKSEQIKLNVKDDFTIFLKDHLFTMNKSSQIKDNLEKTLFEKILKAL